MKSSRMIEAMSDLLFFFRCFIILGRFMSGPSSENGRHFGYGSAKHASLVPYFNSNSFLISYLISPSVLSFSMGGNWYDMSVFYGIVFDLDHVKAIFKAMNEGKIQVPDSCKLMLWAGNIHSRSEDILEHCMGFLGIVRSEITSEEFDALKPAFHKALDENRELLIKLGAAEVAPAWRGGILEDLDTYLDRNPESSDEESDEKQSKPSRRSKRSKR